MGVDGKEIERQKAPRVKRRKQRLFIHTSPFLRCIQTSIAISAGLEQSKGLSGPQASPPTPPHHPMHSGSPRSRAADHWNVSHLSAILEPEENVNEEPEDSPCNPKYSAKPRLRIDAFLGEWLSPDYFESITPPPNSVMMIASAKADLLRQGEGIEIPQSSDTSILNRGNFPGGWGSERSSPANSAEDSCEGPLANTPDLRSNLPRFSRSSSHGGAGLSGSRAYQQTAMTEGKVGLGPYTPPTPAYAISTTDAIPVGYVAHARDACVEVDYQWDSMRLPHDWGDGGSIGEEWSSMHKRFRRGLNNMISWYRNCNARARENKPIEERSNGKISSDEGEKEEIETILVLITHGAGCNALIGALTNQPVLLDVGMASLTMAVRKNHPQIDQSSSSSSSSSLLNDASTATSSWRRRSLIDPGVSEDYELKLTASTDHLRAHSKPSPASLAQRSVTFSSHNNLGYRYRPGSSTTLIRSDSAIGWSQDQADRGRTSATATPTGLWTKPITPVQTERGRNSDAKPPNRNGETNNTLPSERLVGSKMKNIQDVPKSSKPDPSSAIEDEEDYRFPPQSRLWGAPPQALGMVRDGGQKRRWTHSEH